MTEITEKQIFLQRAALGMVLLNAFTTPMMLSAANVALPAIARDLKIHAVMLSWVPMAYLMASAMFVLIFGRIADMVGRKRIFMTGIVCVVITSIMAALSVNGYMLIGARFLQGVSAAMLYATQIAIISSVYPPAKRGQMIGLTIAMIYLGLTCGPVAGGYLIDVFGWRYSFVFHIPLAIIALLIAVLFVPTEWSAEVRGKFDIKGAVNYSLAIVFLCVGVSLLPDWHSYILVLAGVAIMVLFFRLARKTEHPIFDVRLFYTNRVFAMSSLASLILYTSTFANVVLISLYLQYLKDMSAGTAGLFMMIQPLTMAVVSPFTGHLSDRVEPRFIATMGMFITMMGLVMLALLNGVSSMHYLVIALMITGAGFSLFSPPNTNAIMGSVEKRYYGSAAGSIGTMRTLGQMNSMVLVTLVFALVIGKVEIHPENYADLQKAITICFSLAALFCVPGLLFSLFRGRVHE
ncbi:MAG TPA: MFS transporter [Gammaproteobacteria bacterium]|nr:MFS transporter [Gammaproteobacteria bacterium]